LANMGAEMTALSLFKMSADKSRYVQGNWNVNRSQPRLDPENYHRPPERNVTVRRPVVSARPTPLPTHVPLRVLSDAEIEDFRRTLREGDTLIVTWSLPGLATRTSTGVVDHSGQHRTFVTYPAPLGSLPFPPLPPTILLSLSVSKREGRSS
jgi:hypothetical protein